MTYLLRQWNYNGSFSPCSYPYGPEWLGSYNFEHNLATYHSREKWNNFVYNLFTSEARRSLSSFYFTCYFPTLIKIAI